MDFKRHITEMLGLQDVGGLVFSSSDGGVLRFTETSIPETDRVELNDWPGLFGLGGGVSNSRFYPKRAFIQAIQSAAIEGSDFADLLNHGDWIDIYGGKWRLPTSRFHGL